eukprot:6198397-Pleurochrysis_carterae.AAC.3
MQALKRVSCETESRKKQASTSPASEKKAAQTGLRARPAHQTRRRHTHRLRAHSHHRPPTESSKE